MSALSVFSDAATPLASTPAASSTGVGTTSSTSGISNPFVALLSGLIAPSAKAPLGEQAIASVQRDGELAVETLGEDAAAALNAISRDDLAQLPSDVAAALADVAQALNQLQAGDISTKTGLDDAAVTSKATRPLAAATNDEPLTANALINDSFLTAMPAPMLLRQDLGRGASSASSGSGAAPNALTLAASALSLRAGQPVALTSIDPDDLTEAMASPHTSDHAFSTALNSTRDLLAAAKDAAALASTSSALKDAMLQAGVSADQADQLVTLSAQGQPAATNASASPTLSASSSAAPASQWTVPGHALLYNSAWSSAMADRITWLGQHGLTSASLHITPDDLGPIHVRIQMGEEGAKLAFSADHHDTQGLIERMLPKLNAAFEAQGLRIDDVRVQSGATQAAQMDVSQHSAGRDSASQQAQGSMSGSGGEGRSSAGSGAAAASGDGAETLAFPTTVSRGDTSQLDAYA